MASRDATRSPPARLRASQKTAECARPCGAGGWGRASWGCRGRGVRRRGGRGQLLAAKTALPASAEAGVERCCGSRAPFRPPSRRPRGAARSSWCSWQVKGAGARNRAGHLSGLPPTPGPHSLCSGAARPEFSATPARLGHSGPGPPPPWREAPSQPRPQALSPSTPLRPRRGGARAAQPQSSLPSLPPASWGTGATDTPPPRRPPRALCPGGPTSDALTPGRSSWCVCRWGHGLAFRQAAGSAISCRLSGGKLCHR